MSARRYSILKPGGNDTALYEGVIHNGLLRGRLDDDIKALYPNVEQTGFVNLDLSSTELMMAGGEFCGNATRSTAWLALGGKPGNLEIRVSGVNDKLKAGVTKSGEAYAQMPIYPEPSRIIPDKEKPGNTTVEMQGITHYVDFDISQISGLTNVEIKTKARKEMARRGLDQKEACGIIYAEKTSDGWAIHPVVLVTDTGEGKESLYYETACGSGTTALGLTLAKQKGSSIIEVPIMQPSGMPISFSVEYDGDKFGYAQIQGPVEPLNRGILETATHTYAVEKIENEDALKKGLEDGLTDLYSDIFGKAPYFEDFTEDGVREIFKDYLDNGILFFARKSETKKDEAGNVVIDESTGKPLIESKVVGFGAATPMSNEIKIKTILEDSGFDTSNSWYMADLGVREDLRRNGFAKKLVTQRLASLPQGSVAIMRTSINNFASQGLYRTLGFTQVEGAYQEVEMPRVNGNTETDRRLFLMKAL